MVRTTEQTNRSLAPTDRKRVDLRKHPALLVSLWDCMFFQDSVRLQQLPTMAKFDVSRDAQEVVQNLAFSASLAFVLWLAQKRKSFLVSAGL